MEFPKIPVGRSATQMLIELFLIANTENLTEKS